MDGIIDVNTMFGPLPVAASDLSVEELGALMRKHDIGACCTLSTLGLLLDHNAGNGATRAASQESPQLLPVATLNPRTCFEADCPIARLASEGFKMLRFFPAAQGWEVDSAAFAALASHADADRLPVMVDITRSGSATRLLNALAARRAPLILAAIDERTMSEAAVLMRAHPNVFVETSRLLAEGAISQMVQIVGADRLLYGSAAPSRPMASGLGALRHAEMTEPDRALILGGNARRLLNL